MEVEAPSYPYLWPSVTDIHPYGVLVGTYITAARQGTAILLCCLGEGRVPFLQAEIPLVLPQSGLTRSLFSTTSGHV